MNGFLDFYTLLFLVLAVVILLRLRSVLGRRTGSERPPFDPYAAPKPNGAGQSDKVVSLPQRGAQSGPGRAEAGVEADDWGEIAAAGPGVASGLSDIRRADPDFDPRQFLDGARMAYEMIVTAFADGDREALKSLLSNEVYEGFVSAIDERERRGETMTSSFVGINRAEIVEAAQRGRASQVTVRFGSQLVSVTRDAEGNVIQGDPTHVSDVTDIWTFAREAGSRDPNWKLVATEAAE